MDNSIDEAMAGFCNDIHISLPPGNLVRVIDNGRGIPVDMHKQYKNRPSSWYLPNSMPVVSLIIIYIR